MKFIGSLFWNPHQSRIRALWRIILYLLVVAVLVNPPILLIDHFIEQVLTQTTTNIIVALGFLGGLYFFIRFIDKGDLSQYGIFYRLSSFGLFMKGTALGVLMVLLIVLGLGLSGQISLGELFYVSAGVQVGIGFVLIGQAIRYFFGSLFEEIMSRSFLIKHISEGISAPPKIHPSTAVWLSCIITSLIFGLLHLANPGATLWSGLNLSLIGFLFALSYVFTGELAWPVGLHFGWNFCQNNIMGFANSGKPTEASLATFNLEGSDLLTGGSFGLEGSVLTTLLLIFVIIRLIWKHSGSVNKFTSR